MSLPDEMVRAQEVAHMHPALRELRHLISPARLEAAFAAEAELRRLHGVADKLRAEAVLASDAAREEGRREEPDLEGIVELRRRAFRLREIANHIKPNQPTA